MRILVVTASRHGTTTRVGEAVAVELRAAGHDVRLQEITEAGELDVGDVARTSDAVVVGGAVYTGSWLSAALEAELALLDVLPTYAFAVGILELTADTTDPRWTAPRTRETATERVVFGGAIDKSVLSLRERSLLAVVRAKEGRYTDWDAVRAWAATIGADLGVRPRG